MNGLVLAAISAIIAILAVFGSAIFLLANGAITLGMFALLAAFGMGGTMFGLVLHENE